MQLDYTDVRQPRISIAEARRTLNRNGNSYTDNQIEAILDYLYRVIEIEIAHQGKTTLSR